MINIQIPQPAQYILNKLNAAGYEAFVVGGCVRDAILSREANDWDITTSALPEEVKQVFKRTIDTGIKHGTVTVLLHEGTFEVTTYRIDGIYEDARHPKEVTFTSDLTEDLRRRDFTINAMAYHPEIGLVDPYHGLDDLNAGIIRAVGNPSERFDEDALRIMRAVRFAAQLGFEIEPATREAISDFAERLTLVSHERIRVELLKLLISAHPDTFKLLYDTGITKVILPEFDELAASGQSEHTLNVIQNIEGTEVLRLTALLHDLGDKKGAFAMDWLRDYKWDNATIDRVGTLVKYQDFPFDVNETGVRTAISIIGEEAFCELAEFLRADGKDQADISELKDIFKTVTERGDCTSLKQLAITGGDLIAAGIKPGKEMGCILQEMLTAVLAEPDLNTKEKLFEKFI